MTLTLPSFTEINLARSRLRGEQIFCLDISQESLGYYLIGQNIMIPGSFAIALEQQTSKDARNRERNLMHTGQALGLAHQIAYDFPDLTDGPTHDEVCAMLNLAAYDERHRRPVRRISQAVRRAFGLDYSWFGGKLRLLTVRQRALKNDMRSARVLTELEQASVDIAALAQFGVRPRYRQAMPISAMPLFSELAEVATEAADD